MRVDFLQDKSLEEARVIVQAPARTKDIDELIEAISNIAPSPISGYSDGVITKLGKDSIIRIYSKDKRVYADTIDSSYLIKSTLYQLEETLPKQFVRISNSEIVNTDKIIRLDLNLAGTIKVSLQGDIETKVSRRYISKVKEVLM
jgi:DNA-binding LytR/AlgR family response regulator